MIFGNKKEESTVWRVQEWYSSSSSGGGWLWLRLCVGKRFYIQRVLSHTARARATTTEGNKRYKKETVLLKDTDHHGWCGGKIIITVGDVLLPERPKSGFLFARQILRSPSFLHPQLMMMLTKCQILKRRKWTGSYLGSCLSLIVCL